MRSFFIALATTVLVQAVDIAKVIELETVQGADWLDSEMSLAQVAAPKKTTSSSGRPSSTSTTSTTITPTTRPSSSSHPTSTTNTSTINTSTRPTSSSVSQPSTKPTASARPSSNSMPTRPTRPSSSLQPPKPTSTSPSKPSSAPARSRSVSTAVYGRPERIESASTAQSVKSRSLSVDSNASRSLSELENNRPAAVTQNQWSAADKLVVGTTILQLPAMVAQTALEAQNAAEQRDLSREQFELNYDLAVQQNDAVEADRLYQQALQDDQLAKDAQAAEIAAIWRAQEAVAADWADAQARADVLYQDLLDNWYLQDDLDYRCGGVHQTTPPGCANAYAELVALQAAEAQINLDFDALDQEMLDLIDVQNQLTQLEEDFCNDDPGEFATDCLAIL